MWPAIIIGIYLLLNHGSSGSGGSVPTFYPRIYPTTYNPDPALLQKLTTIYGPGQLFGNGIINQFYWINYPNPHGEHTYQMDFHYLVDLGNDTTWINRPADKQPKGALPQGFWEACPAGFPGGKQWCHRNEQGFLV